MPSSQPGFVDFFLGKNISMSQGYQPVVLGCPPVLPAVPQLSAVDGVPWIYPGLQGYQFIPYPNSRDIRHMDNNDLKAASPYHQALLGRGASFYSPYRPVAAEDFSRVAKASSRESTSPLKAWLNEHIKNPYPTKGEKIMLAIVTKMSLTQVSTWFANARRRLKKENRMNWAAKGKSDEEEEEEESEDESSGQKSPCSEGEEDIDPQTVDVTGGTVEGASPTMDLHLMQRLSERQRDSSQSDVAPVTNEKELGCVKAVCKENINPPKPKIWSLAETATSGDDRKDRDGSEDKPDTISDLRKCWLHWTSRNEHYPFSDSSQYVSKPSQFSCLN